MRIQSVKRGIISYGKNEWRIATIVTLWGGLVQWPTKTLEKVVALDQKLVSIEWDFASNTEIIEVIRWLNSANYELIFNSDCTDEIWNMVMLRNIIFSILVDIPKEWIPSSMNANTLTYTQEKDELRFKITSKEDWKEFREFQRIKLLTKPWKILEVPMDFKNQFSEIVKDELLPMTKLIVKYI